VLWVLWLCLLGAAGVTVLGVCLPAPAGRGPAFGGAAPDATAWAVVAGGAAVGAVGVLSDRFGRRAVLGAACALLGLARFGAAVAGPGDGVPLLLGCAAAAGLAGVAVLALIGALAADHFGENHSASVLGLLAWAWLLPPALLTGTAAAVGRVPDLHGTLLPAGCTALACTVPALFLKAPGRPSARRIVPNPHPLGEEMA
jgi:MFS family permease